VITVLNAYSGFALVAEGFMLDNPLLTTVSRRTHFGQGACLNDIAGRELDWCQRFNPVLYHGEVLFPCR
jgi:NAD/NADP transhydrogenase beta subunit